MYEQWQGNSTSSDVVVADQGDRDNVGDCISNLIVCGFLPQ